MFPYAKKLVDYIKEDHDAALRHGSDEPNLDALMEPAAHESEPQLLELNIKKKQQMAVLKRMLHDAGYGDLAKMATLSQHRPKTMHPEEE